MEILEQFENREAKLFDTKVREIVSGATEQEWIKEIVEALPNLVKGREALEAPLRNVLRYQRHFANHEAGSVAEAERLFAANNVDEIAMNAVRRWRAMTWAQIACRAMPGEVDLNFVANFRADLREARSIVVNMVPALVSARKNCLAIAVEIETRLAEQLTACEADEPLRVMVEPRHQEPAPRVAQLQSSARPRYF